MEIRMEKLGDYEFEQDLFLLNEKSLKMNKNE
jgi:hypothetical protein